MTHKFHEKTKELNVTIESLTDQRLISPIVSALFAEMDKQKNGSIMTHHKRDLESTPFIDDSMIYHVFYIKDTEDVETNMQLEWLNCKSDKWNHRKWPDLYNKSDSAQWWRNVCDIYDDVRIGYFIIAGVKAGICTLDGRSENGLWGFSSKRIEKNRDNKEEQESGVKWLEDQTWFSGYSSKYYKKKQSTWTANTAEYIRSLPSEPVVQLEENACKKRVELKKKEQEEKDNKERQTHVYKNEMNKLMKLVDYQFQNYILYHMDDPWTLAMKDRQALTLKP